MQCPMWDRSAKRYDGPRRRRCIGKKKELSSCPAFGEQQPAFGMSLEVLIETKHQQLKLLWSTKAIWKTKQYCHASTVDRTHNHAPGKMVKARELHVTEDVVHQQ